MEFTIGVEEEYQIIDPTTRGLQEDVKPILKAAQQGVEDNVVQAEMHRCQVEIATGVCQTLADVRTELQRLRRQVIQAAADHGSVVAAGGTHPFSSWKSQQITPKSRYEQLEADLQQTIRELIIFGCHVHVGLRDRDAAIEVINRARIWLPTLLALSANSPFWLGVDTGYDSYRTELWSRLPTAGAPPWFSSYADQEHLAQSLIQSGVVGDATKIYWDIRLSQRFPTVEFRATDVCLTIDEAVMIAGLVRSLVQTCYQHHCDRVPYPKVHSELLRSAQWAAARYGLSGKLVDVQSATSRPAADLVEQLLDFVRPALTEQGDWHMVAALVQKTMKQGNGAQRQRQVYEATQDYQQVVDFLVEQTAAGVS